MYILVAEDLYSRTGFALGTTSHGSQTMAHFLYLVSTLFPYPIVHVLTDNGSEFKKYFNRLCGKKSITHFHTYPRTPKMNAHCERLNRTLQEECIDFYANILFDDITKFNDILREYLDFYNTERVHHAWKNKQTPIQAMLQSNHYQSNLPMECKDGWAYTPICTIRFN
jgi:transposase InsO family protein